MRERVELGRVSGVFGVRGWVKVFSHTRPRDEILNYQPWFLRVDGEWREFRLEQGREQSATLVAKLSGCDDRNAAQQLIGCTIAVAEAQLARLDTGEYYWRDLVGLRVITESGEEIGQVKHLMETGANDVLIIEGERERLIPFTAQAVRKVNLADNTLVVDWDPEF